MGDKSICSTDATNSYVYRMQIYNGKTAEAESSACLCSCVALDLTPGLGDSGFDLHTDNYYTSPKLHLQLYEKGMNARGTVRGNSK